MQSRVGIGIIGCGGMAEKHINYYRQVQGAEVRAICDISQERLNKVSGKFGIEDAYMDYMELLARDDIHAVDICTPNFLHVEQAVNAAKAGKHVLCQKPIATTIEGANQIINAAKENGVKLCVIYVGRTSPQNNFALKLIQEGHLGKITFIRGRLSHANGLKITPDSWRYYKDKVGGGSFMQLGVHYADLFRFFNGGVKRVAAIGRTFTCDMEGDDTMGALLEFEQGAVGVLETGYSVRSPRRAVNCLEIYGDKGTILMDMDCGIRVYTVEGKYRAEVDGKKEWYIPSEEEMLSTVPFGNFVEHWVDCIVNDKEPMVTGEEGRASLEIITAAQQASDEERFVELKYQSW